MVNAQKNEQITTWEVKCIFRRCSGVWENVDDFTLYIREKHESSAQSQHIIITKGELFIQRTINSEGRDVRKLYIAALRGEAG